MTVITAKNKARAKLLCANLTLNEKIGMIHGAGLFRTEGVPRLGIPPMRMSDGPMGVRREFENDSWKAIDSSRDYVTYLPCGSAVASTWNTKLAHYEGQVLGQEARGRGKDMILGPSVNIKRSPLCGRNFEYLSEDPCLAASMCVPLIQGVQESDVASCVKHFVANSQETDRLEVNEIISQRALHELYLPAFAAAVQQGEVLTVMSAYNTVNGERCSESTTLLDDTLRDDWGFDGLVVSDWGGVQHTGASAEVGMDIEMSVTSDFDEYKFANPLNNAIANGEVDEQHIDRKVIHILGVMDALHMLKDKNEATTVARRKRGCYATSEHRAKALEVARESVVLLKNDAAEGQSPLLPLPAADMDHLLVVGANADAIHSNGGGSAEIKAQYEVTPLLGLCGQLGGNCEVTYAPGYCSEVHGEQDDAWQAQSLENGMAHNDHGANEASAKALQDEALRLAKQSDHVVFIGGLNHDFDLEGLDRKDMKLPYGQDELIEALLDVNPNTVVVLIGGSPVEMPWAERAKAIVWSWYGGVEAGTALAEVLLGSVNPSGHLPESFPTRLEDSPANTIGTFGLNGQVEYREDLYVGYRHYETRHVPVRFCFGHGLSYTTFDFANLDVSVVGDTVRVHLDVTNTGKVAGQSVPQVYFGLEGTGEDRPVKELKGFAKLKLEPGERRTVRIDIPVNRALGYYSTRFERDVLAEAATIYVGQSVDDIRLSSHIEIKSR